MNNMSRIHAIFIFTKSENHLHVANLVISMIKSLENIKISHNRCIICRVGEVPGHGTSIFLRIKLESIS